MCILIDFHYSNTWADPSHQTKPAAWTNLSFEDLKTALANHTLSVLTTLNNNGITPEWVQVGNETSNGMLWDDGKASANMANYAALTTAGYYAVKSVFPSTNVIVHLNNGYDNSMYRWIFDELKANGKKKLLQQATNYQEAHNDNLHNPPVHFRFEGFHPGNA